MTVTIDNITGDIIETRDQAVAHLSELGRQGGQGADSILKAAMFATKCVASKLANEDDAKEFYLAYRDGFDGEVKLADNLVDEDKIKAHVSIFRTFMKAAVVKNSDIHARALGLRCGLLAEQRKHSAYNGLVAVNRAQAKKGFEALTDDEMLDILCKEEATEKGEIEKLEALLKAARKIEKDFGGMVSVIHALELRLDAAKVAAMAADAPLRLVA